MFDPVEEPLDLVASAVEIGAEADRIAAIAFGGMLAHSPFFMASFLIQSARSHGRQAALTRISDERAVFRQVERHGLTRAQRQPYRQTIAIDHRMNFARQAVA